MRVVDEAGPRSKLERVHTDAMREAELELKLESVQLTAHAKERLIVSAPGKVILFGEHAVVHGVVSHFSSGRHSLRYSLSEHPHSRLPLLALSTCAVTA